MPPVVTKAIWSVAVLVALFGGFKLWLTMHDAALLQGYVLQSEKSALESQLAELERQRNAAAQSLEEYRKRAMADALTQQRLEAQLEQAIKDDNQNVDDGDYRWTDDDRLWLCKQRGAPDCSR
ncbi:hypothetical protein [Agrobacterium tumefaciens]|uniref:hypothetical protein n=1 Tax=Agrobacterium tumefaciens TaxID=358 RepID=UPI001572F91C|nr:hypothetical protein [Agrobacterium tumefaciens]NTB01063.1 hypothetical protein [Agrobacterium tumefaciens]